MEEEEDLGGDRRRSDAHSGGRIDLKSPDQMRDLTGQVHHLPCCIRHDGPCPVSDYFKPKQTGVVVEGLEVEEASFRGRRLRGTTLPIPEGYVLKKSGSSEDNSNCWEAHARFQNATYWNHDSQPSHNDAFVRSFHWLTVSDALHKPVTEDDLASLSSNGI